MSEASFCPTCGYKNRVGFNFCTKCGLPNPEGNPLVSEGYVPPTDLASPASAPPPGYNEAVPRSTSQDGMARQQTPLFPPEHNPSGYGYGEGDEQREGAPGGASMFSNNSTAQPYTTSSSSPADSDVARAHTKAMGLIVKSAETRPVAEMKDQKVDDDRRGSCGLKSFRIPQWGCEGWLLWWFGVVCCVGAMIGFWVVFIQEVATGSRPFQAVCTESAFGNNDMADHVCLFAFGQFAYGIFAFGQFAIGIVAIGQMSVGLLFGLGMLAGGSGITIAMLAVSVFPYASLLGIGLWRCWRSLIGVNLLEPFFGNRTLSVGCRPSTQDGPGVGPGVGMFGRRRV